MQLYKRVSENLIRAVSWFAFGFSNRSGCSRALIFCALFAALSFSAFSQSRYEGQEIGDVAIALEETSQDAAAGEEFRLIARRTLGTSYSAVRIRDTIEQLYETRSVASISVEAAETANNRVNLRFVIKRKTQAQRVAIVIVDEDNSKFTEQELLFRLNLLEAGTAITEQTLRNNANFILEYLRDRGFYKAEVVYEQMPPQGVVEVSVTFRVTTGEQATVDTFNIKIEGFDPLKFTDKIKLKPGETFTREKLTADVEKIREILRDEDRLAPRLNDARVVYESEKNAVDIELTGEQGPIVEIVVEPEEAEIGGRTQERLLPVKREGTIDYAAIIEGERRLENYYQERGYFFVNVTAVCSVDPPLTESESSVIKNDTEFLCAALNNAELAEKKVTVKYRVELDRQLKLTDMRLEGTDQFTITDIKPALETQEANLLGIIPIFGYGRGYTSEKLLEEDSSTIRSLLRELGYRDATVRANQGVSPDGENLIITFVVEQGPATVVSGLEIKGNNAFTDDELLAQIPVITGQNYSRAKLRNAQRKLSQFYSQAGYYDAVVNFSIDERSDDPVTGKKLFKVAFEIENEGRKVFINRILVTGNEDTKTKAIERALTLRAGEVLRAGDIYTSEQNLFGSDAFTSVTIKPRPAGERPDGSRTTDLIVTVDEQAPRILSYGGGFSTDLGASGFVDIRHLNLFGRLWQGGARLRVSQRQQLAGIDFVNPRFIRDGEKRFAPLTLSAQYQRDSTVTRFFRSAFDKGTFGIVQRVDENGNAIDQFGAEAGDPTLNRLTLTAETNRTISRKNRSILFFRYRFEDVRIYKIESLLIKDLLAPDSRIRISGFGATFVRDTRERCGIEYTVLEIIARGEPGEPCRYSASDPTNGSYLTAEYNVSLPVLGANIGFNKFQAAYNYYYTLNAFRKTTFAARAIIGLGQAFSSENRFPNNPELDGLLPISERFFGGGSNTLRGFDFESAGPRVAVVPEGFFRNSQGEPVFLDPFTVPFGGNALAVVNLEARIPLTKSIRAVPFYDGGNVFTRVGDIFNPPNAPPNDIARQNLRALWTHTVGLGLRLKTPVGGEFGIDYGYLLNPPRFLLPQVSAPNAIIQLPQSQIHFRFSQAF